MSKNLRKAIAQLREAKEAGAKQEEEQRRRERVIAELNAVEEKRRQDDLYRIDDNRSPIQRARDEGDVEMIEEFEWLLEQRQPHWRGGGDGA
jgi:hypothetical protein